MRDLLNLITEAQSFTPPRILYHGTHPDKAETILRDGLSAEHDSSWQHFGQGVYLASLAETARNYGAAVFAVDLTKIDIRKLVPDDHELYDYFEGAWGDGDEGDYGPDEDRPEGIFEADWTDSIRICGQCQYLGDIPADCIILI